MREVQFKVRGPVGTDLFKRVVDSEIGLVGSWVRCDEKEIQAFQEERWSLLPRSPKEIKAANKKAKKAAKHK